MRTIRCFVDQPLAVGQVITLPEEASAHLLRVLRLAAGDEVVLFNGDGGDYGARLRSAAKRGAEAEVHSRRDAGRESPLRITLAQGIARGEKMDWTLQKATELGVRRLSPVVTRRTIAERINLDRMRANAIEAAEQCGRTALPVIGEPIALDQLLRRDDRTLYFADEGGGEPAASAFKPGPATILTGPEGGFTDEERATIRAAPNAVAISLGPRILRAETATLAALAAWMAVAGDWRL